MLVGLHDPPRLSPLPRLAHQDVAGVTSGPSTGRRVLFTPPVTIGCAQLRIRFPPRLPCSAPVRRPAMSSPRDSRRQFISVGRSSRSYFRPEVVQLEDRTAPAKVTW